MITKPLASFISFCAVVVTAVGQLTAAEKPELLAQTAAEQWLTQVDAGKFAESWQSAAAFFKGAVTEAQWKTALDAFRMFKTKHFQRMILNHQTVGRFANNGSIFHANVI